MAAIASLPTLAAEFEIRGTDQLLPPIGENDHVTRLDVRGGMLDQAEVVTRRVAETVGGRRGESCSLSARSAGAGVQ